MFFVVSCEACGLVSTLHMWASRQSPSLPYGRPISASELSGSPKGRGIVIRTPLPSLHLSEMPGRHQGRGRTPVEAFTTKNYQ